MELMLFIGGPADGQRYEVPAGRREWEVTIRESVPITPWAGGKIQPTPHKIVMYYRVRIGNCFVMAYDQWPDNAIGLLIRNYKPKEG